MEPNIKTWRQTLLWVGLFALAMGYLESAVVVYLREIYYPDGFSFPLKAMSKDIAITELCSHSFQLVAVCPGGNPVFLCPLELLEENYFKPGKTQGNN